MRKFEHGGMIRGRNIRLDFSVNTNPLGMCGEVKKAVTGAADLYEKYPDPKYTDLKNAIAEYENVNAENIAVSNGASEMIFAAVRAVMPKRAAMAAPCFSEYERALLSVGSEIIFYDTCEKNNFEVREDFLKIAKDADMVFLTNPNNPTGTLINDTITDALPKTDAVCVIDECFLPFTDGESAKGKMPVIKAFTKTHAMAGLRLGYMIADAEFTERVNAQLPAWNVNAAAAAAAIAACGCDGHIKKAREIIKEEREYLGGEFSRLGFKVFKSDANFLLIKGKEGVGEALLKRGILIRECDNFRNLDARFYRVAVKTHVENEILIRELGEVMWQMR